MGARRHRRRLLVRLCGVRCRQSADRALDGSLWPARGDGTRRSPDGRRVAAGAADDAALASLSHHRRIGRRGQRLPRLFRPIAVRAELVHSPARPCDGAGVCRRRRRLGDLAALGAAHDRADRLADRLHRDGHFGPRRAGADQPAAAQTAGGYRASAGRRRRADSQFCEANLVYRRSRLGRHRLDLAPCAWHRTILVDRDRLLLRPVHLVRGAGAPDQIPARYRLQRRMSRSGRSASSACSAFPARSGSGICPTGSGANGSGP